MSNASEVTARIERLFVYPVKSCAGIELKEALLTETGLDLDRAWMVVDEAGEFVTQRELPRLALVRPQLKLHEVVLRAPGMLALHLSIDTVEEPVRVRVWDDEVAAYDMGAVAAQWFSDFLGQRLRLVRFDPEQKRLSNPAWTGEVEAPNQFSDGYPLLVASTASLDLLNEKLVAGGHPPVGMERFRPNIVIEAAAGEDGFVEDAWIGRELTAGEVSLKVIDTMVRCVMTTLPQGDLPNDPGILRTLADHHRVLMPAVGRELPAVGVAVTVMSGGRISRGDALAVQAGA